MALTLFINWAVKPFTMYGISCSSSARSSSGFIGPDAVDLLRMPIGLDLDALGATYGAGTVVLHGGVKMLEVPLWRSYLAGCILLGVAPCTAMVLVWGYLAKGNDGHTLVMVAINSLTMLVLYGVLGGFLLGRRPVARPVAGPAAIDRRLRRAPARRGLTSRGRRSSPRGARRGSGRSSCTSSRRSRSAALLHHARPALPLQGRRDPVEPADDRLDCGAALSSDRLDLRPRATASREALEAFSYEDAAPTAMIGASNHFEVAIATATILFGLSSGAALATVVGVLIEVPVMLMLVKICLQDERRISGDGSCVRRASRGRWPGRVDRRRPSAFQRRTQRCVSSSRSPVSRLVIAGGHVRSRRSRRTRRSWRRDTDCRRRAGGSARAARPRRRGAAHGRLRGASCWGA